MKITLQDAIKEVAREVKLRERLYPQWIAAGKLSKAAAERQLARLKYALELLEGKQKGQHGNKQPELFELNKPMENPLQQKIQELEQLRHNLLHSLRTSSGPEKAYQQISLEVVEGCQAVLREVLEKVLKKATHKKKHSL